LDSPESTVTIRPNGEYRADWRVQANTTGKLTLLAKALTDTESDAVEMTMDIVPHGLRRTTGNTTTVTQNDADQNFNLDVPGLADTQARALRIEVSPSIAGALFGALDYLTSYPYGCTEQTMSSFLPNIVVAQTLKDIPTAKIRASNDLDNKVRKGLDRLYAYQHADGGWGWWKDDKTDPFMTAYVVDGLTMATRAGYPAESGRMVRGREKLKQLVASGKLENGKTIDMESRAYMIYALTTSGNTGAAAVNDLFARRNELQPYGRALLALTLKLRGDDGRSRQVAHEIESSANSNEFEAHWDSERRPMLDFSERDDLEATSLSLKALSQILPTSAVSPRTAKWLLANRRFGYYWDSTRQTAFAIFGLIDYIKVTKELAADYDVEVYLNGQQAAPARHMTSADAASGTSITVERKAGEVGGSNQVRIVKRGSGVAYVSA